MIEGAGRIDGEDRDGQGGDSLKKGRDLRQGNPVTALCDQQSVGDFHRPNRRNQGFGAGRKQVENASVNLVASSSKHQATATDASSTNRLVAAAFID